MCQFFLGTPQPQWLEQTGVRLFVSRRRFSRRLKVPQARGEWAIDSGGYSELTMHGSYQTTPTAFIGEVRAWQRAGGLRWAAIQDWMCEDAALSATGLTVAEHQRRTIQSLTTLRTLAPDLPWTPVLQGRSREDYSRHVQAYTAAGFDLTREPIVGVGTMCRRQGTGEATAILEALNGEGLRLHAFGFKADGLRAAAHLLTSADSMAWSQVARRRKIRLPGCTHQTCNSCIRFALQWRDGITQINGIG